MPMLFTDHCYPCNSDSLAEINNVQITLLTKARDTGQVAKDGPATQLGWLRNLAMLN